MSCRQPPAYFNKIKEEAKETCDLIENNKKISGAWNLLFKQLRNPRHVLSELLQNADDAGATFASANIIQDVFIFEHNGKDFSKENLESICSFACSNKKTLHTIGFRGIGFKSTFGLGPDVIVLTSTLAFKFNERRFIEPVWLDDAPDTGLTRIMVKLKDEHVKEELLKNLREWTNSPASLLFFNNIKKLTIVDRTIEVKKLRQGPVKNSEYLSISSDNTKTVLLIRSELEDFPQDALEEIKKERNITGYDENEFFMPPCKVDIILGLDGEQRIFAILPTDVSLTLPFSCNGPFVQDPARFGIEDIARSPTNRWLFERVGKLAAHAMVEWLDNRNLPISGRADAYSMLPELQKPGGTLKEACENSVKNAFADTIRDEKVLLSTSGTRVNMIECLAPPMALYDIWTPAQICKVFDKEGHSVITAAIPVRVRERLASHGLLFIIESSYLITKLKTSIIPKPETWKGLFNLWLIVQNAYCQNEAYFVPVKGYHALMRVRDVVFPGGTFEKLTSDDIEFLMNYLIIIDAGWIEYIKELEKTDGDNKDVLRIKQLLKSVGFDVPTKVDVVLSRAYNLMIRRNAGDQELIRLTHLFAHTGVAVPGDFIYIARDGVRTHARDIMAFDLTGQLSDLLPDDITKKSLISDGYHSKFISCKPDEWELWLRTGKGGLYGFVGIEEKNEGSVHLWRINDLLEKRREPPVDESKLRRKTRLFYVYDHDFNESVWRYWQSLNSDTIWIDIFRLLVSDPKNMWKDCLYAKIEQAVSTETYEQRMVASWILKLRDVPCIPDTFGNPRKPAELLMRNQYTEMFIGTEPFVASEIDERREVRELLRFLGVRENPSSVESFIERLSALSMSTEPIVPEVRKWCEKIDVYLSRANQSALRKAREAFESGRLIMTTDFAWKHVNEVFLSSGDGTIPGLPVVHPAIRDLSMWRRIGVQEMPTMEHVIAWLKTLEQGKKISAGEITAVKESLKRFPRQVWDECGCWITAGGVWSPVSALSYKVATPGAWKELHPHVKEKTADLRMMEGETSNEYPFTSLRDLSSIMTKKVYNVERSKDEDDYVEWISLLSGRLRLVKFDDEGKMIAVRNAADRLFNASVCFVRSLSVSQYIDDVTPASVPYEVDVLWDGDILYIKEMSLHKLYTPLVAELLQAFKVPEIKDAIAYCYNRDARSINAYLDENFSFEEAAAGQFEPSVTIIEDKDEELEEDEVDAASGEDGEDIQGIEEEEPAIEDIPDNMAVSGTVADGGVRDRKQKELSVIDRFTLMMGYKWNDAGQRYSHPDGSWMERSREGFNLVRYDRHGESPYYYWVSPKSLSKGIEMPVSVYSLIREHYNDRSSIIMPDDKGRPEEISGSILVELIENKDIIVYDAVYRLRRGG